FQVVLVEPEIPQNTGNIGRLRLATQSKLHLVKPLGFSIDEKALRRAGLDYWKHLDVQIHDDLPTFLQQQVRDAPIALWTTKAGKTLYEASLTPGTFLFFGKETAGLPSSFLESHALDSYRIPILDARVRSLNLANAVSIVLYE